MALEEYKRKRDFQQTPEPPAKVERGKARRFVVQKHRASHLHYDFRLEMEGVLKSWAVPKGPPLDPKEKRLAMMVEDHPVSYFHFEGIIPPGNYGAGTVQVWDTGTWEPADGANPSAMLKDGDLKFMLHGEKLKGEFVLARMRSRRPGSKGTEWLLIKKKDVYAVAGFDAGNKEYDYSVLSRRSLAEIGGDEGSAEWQSNRTSAKKAKASWLKLPQEKAAPKRASAKAKAAKPTNPAATPTNPAKKKAASALASTVKKKSQPRKKRAA
ncbi:MAG TPA: DNA polymerase ligase N-terminal domain-containing protein [Terriglobales bacterium]|nr:DNA polymerase ligase N-terminal domain-containing protein [Terriglobales bacterium]